MHRMTMMKGVAVALTLVVATAIAIAASPHARADHWSNGQYIQTSDWKNCAGGATRLCLYRDIDYHGDHDSFRCDRVGEQSFDWESGEASSIVNNCKPGSAFLLKGKAADGQPAPTLRVDGQTRIPWLGSVGFNDTAVTAVRIADGAPAFSASDYGDEHTCRGDDTRICFFRDENFAGEEKSFRCDGVGVDSLDWLYQEASSVINNCRAGSAYRVIGAPAGQNTQRQLDIAGQSEIGVLRYHDFDNAAQTVIRLDPSPAKTS